MLGLSVSLCRGHGRVVRVFHEMPGMPIGHEAGVHVLPLIGFVAEGGDALDWNA